jgi:dephospho-CoA kinase
MKTIGLTGGIGSGKSTVAKVFLQLGIPVFNADEEAKLLYSKEAIREKVLNLLGKDCYFESGELNRVHVAEKVFADKNLLKQLNNIIHPAVEKSFERWEEMNANCIFGLKEAAIFFESGLNERIKKVIVVTAPEWLRLERVKQRDGKSEVEIKARIENQWPESELIKRATFVLANDGSKLIVPEIVSLHQQINQLVKDENF